MRKEDIPEALAGCDEKLLADALPKKQETNNEQGWRGLIRKKPLWVAAAALTLALLGGAVWSMLPGKNLPAPVKVKAETLGEAVYPIEAAGGVYLAKAEKMIAQGQEVSDQLRQILFSLNNDLFLDSYGAGTNLAEFFQKLAAASFKDAGTQNRLIAPLNLYYTLAMLAEATGGETRAEILQALNAESMEALREQAKKVWQANYFDNGDAKCLLGGSIWLRNDLNYKEACIELLRENYYASAFRGEMGSEEYSQLLQDWINEQTGGLLKDSVSGLDLPTETVVAMVSTFWLKGTWSAEFDAADNTKGLFHGAAGDSEAEFMHAEDMMGMYFEGDHFAAYQRYLNGVNASMIFVLPEEGTAPEQLLEDPEALSFLFSQPPQEMKEKIVILTMPKFDISEERMLSQVIRDLGITTVFNSRKADFSGLLEGKAYLSSVKQGARISVDEKGVEAAAFIMAGVMGARTDPQKVEFTLDRPFLFVLRTRDDLPVLIGIVNQP